MVTGARCSLTHDMPANSLGRAEQVRQEILEYARMLPPGRCCAEVPAQLVEAGAGLRQSKYAPSKSTRKGTLRNRMRVSRSNASKVLLPKGCVESTGLQISQIWRSRGEIIL